MIFVKAHDTKYRFVIGLENVLFFRLVRALFSPEMLQAVSVKGLSFKKKTEIIAKDYVKIGLSSL